MRSRIIGFMLSLMMCLSIISFSAQAEEPEPITSSEPETEEIMESEEQPAEEVSEVLTEDDEKLSEETGPIEEEPEDQELVSEEPETTEETVTEEQQTEQEPAAEETVAEEEAVSEEAEEPAEEMAVNVISWEDLLEKGTLDEGEVIVLTEDTVLPEDAFLMIQGGTLTVESSTSLTLKGLLIIQDGTLVVEEEADLDNEFFVMVSEKGSLEVKGNYTQAEEAALVWEDLEGKSDVSGVSETLIDKTISAADMNELTNALVVSEYRTLTIQVSDQELVKGLSADIPDGVIITAR